MRGIAKRVLLPAAFCFAAFAAYEYGPAARDAWRLEHSLDLQGRSAATANARAADLAQTCGLCHGAEGNSQSAFYPKLAGQPAAYLLSQLNDFAEGRRVAPQMQPLAIQLTAEERQLISGYYASLPAVPVPDASSVSTGLAPCTACHGPALEGAVSPSPTPRLAGQGRGYILKQLEAFKGNQRSDPLGAMNAVARALDQAQIESLASAISTYQILDPQSAR